MPFSPPETDEYVQSAGWTPPENDPIISEPSGQPAGAVSFPKILPAIPLPGVTGLAANLGVTAFNTANNPPEPPPVPKIKLNPYDELQVTGNPMTKSFEQYQAENPSPSTKFIQKILPSVKTPEQQEQLAQYIKDVKSPELPTSSTAGQVWEAINTPPKPIAELRELSQQQDAESDAFKKWSRDILKKKGYDQAKIDELTGKPDSKLSQIASGAGNAVVDLGLFFTSPMGLATLGIAGLPKAAQKAVSLAFSVQMASQLPSQAVELLQEVNKPADQRDWKKISNLVVSGAATTGFVALGAAHGLKSKLDDAIEQFHNETKTAQFEQTPGEFIFDPRNAQWTVKPAETPQTISPETGKPAAAPPADVTPEQIARLAATGARILVARGVQPDVANRFANNFVRQSGHSQVGEQFRSDLNNAFNEAGFKTAADNTYSNEAQLRNAAEANGFTEDEIQLGIEKHAQGLMDIAAHNQQVMDRLAPVQQTASPTSLPAIAPVKFAQVQEGMPSIGWYSVTKPFDAPDGSTYDVGKMVSNGQLERWGMKIPDDEQAKFNAAQPVNEPETKPAAVVAKNAPTETPATPVAETKPSYRQSKVDWGLENLPFGETASVPNGDGSFRVMTSLDAAGIPVRDRLKMVAGEMPMPTKEQFIKGVENKYYYDGSDLLDKVKSEMATLGLDVKRAKLPRLEDFKTAKEFYEAAEKLESDFRSKGVSIMAAMVENKQMPKPFSKTDFTPAEPTPPAPSAGAEGKAAVDAINKRDWWHVEPKDQSTYSQRGKFYSSSEKEAEFYNFLGGNTIVEKVKVSNPLIGDEQFIEQQLGLSGESAKLPPPESDQFYNARADLDRRMALAARAKGYDAIALTTPKGFEAFKANGKLPRSIELNALHDLESGSSAEIPIGKKPKRVDQTPAWQVPLADFIQRRVNETQNNSPSFVNSFELSHKNQVRMAIKDGEKVPQKVLDEYPDLASPKPSSQDLSTPVAPAETKGGETQAPKGGVPYVVELGKKDALDPARKRMRAVPQNYKLAYINGWYEAKKSPKPVDAGEGGKPATAATLPFKPTIPFARQGELRERPDAELFAIKPSKDGNDFLVKRYSSRKALEAFLKNAGGWKAVVKNQVEKNMVVHPAFEVERAGARVVETPATIPAKLTPMMEQYQKIKSQLPQDAILAFRLGDFYEFFFDDAVEASKLLKLSLTNRNGTPMAGIPYHAAQSYFGKLVSAGKKVAVADAAEADLKSGKPVERKVTEIIGGKVETPAQATAKAADQVATVAKTEGVRPAKEVKSELVNRLESALKKSKSENDVDWTAPKAGKVTIEIPGDGKFTIVNSKEAIGQVLKDAKKLSTSSTEPTRVPTVSEILTHRDRITKIENDAIKIYGDARKAIQKMREQADNKEIEMDDRQRNDLRDVASDMEERLPENLLRERIKNTQDDITDLSETIPMIREALPEKENRLKSMWAQISAKMDARKPFKKLSTEHATLKSQIDSDKSSIKERTLRLAQRQASLAEAQRDLAAIEKALPKPAPKPEEPAANLGEGGSVTFSLEPDNALKSNENERLRTGPNDVPPLRGIANNVGSGQPLDEGSSQEIQTPIPSKSVDEIRAAQELVSTLLKENPKLSGAARTDVQNIRAVEAPVIKGVEGLEATQAAWRAIANAFGQRIVFIELGKTLSHVNAATVRGIGNTIFINARSKRAFHSLVGHEMLHDIENTQPELYRELLSKLETLMLPEKVEQYRQWRVKNGLPEKLVKEELLADLFERSFNDPEFWNKLAAKEPTLFQKLATTVLDFLTRLKQKLFDNGAYKYFPDIGKAHDVIAESLAKFAKEKGGQPPMEGDVTFSTETPGEPVPPKEEENPRAQVGGIPEVGQRRPTEHFSEIRPLVREHGFDSTQPITAENTAKAWTALEGMTDPARRGSVAQDYLNKFGGADLSLGIFKGELEAYALKLAAEGDKSLYNAMLNHSKDFVTILEGGDTAAGRSQRAAAERAASPAVTVLRNAVTLERDRAAAQGLKLTESNYQLLQNALDNLKIPEAEIEPMIDKAVDAVTPPKPDEAADQAAMRKAAKNKSIKGLMDEIKNTPLRFQLDPLWRRGVAERWFRKAGLTDEQASQAADLFEKEFNKAFNRAAEKVAKDVLKGANPETTADIIKAIRAGVMTPGSGWADEFAKKTGWKPPTDEQFKKLVELDAKLADTDLSAAEIAAIHNQMMRIAWQFGKREGAAMKAVAESFVGSLLSGIRTLTVQLTPAIQAVRDLAIASISDPKNALQFARALVNSAKHNIVSESKYAWQNDAYKFHLGELDLAHSQLDRIWQEADLAYKNGTPPQKAWARVRQLFAINRFVFKVLNTMDNTAMAATREWKLAYYSSLAFKEAGLSTSKIDTLVDAMALARQASYDRAIAAGLDDLTARVRANDEVKAAVQDFVANRTGSDTIANQVLDSAEKDVYSTVGRKADGIDEMDEGFLSRLFPNDFMSFLSKLRDQGGAKSLLATALFGFVNIPYRTVRFASAFSPYGLLRYGIHQYRVGHQQETYWKQSFANTMQAKARLREAIAGTVTLTLAAVWAGFNNSSDDKAGEEDAGLYITGAGAQNKVLADAWRKRGFRPYALNFVFGGRIVSIPLTRAGEMIMFPFMISAALDDAAWKKKERAATGQPPVNPASLYTASIVGTTLSMMGQKGIFQTVGNLTQSIQGGDTWVKAAAKLGASVTSATVIPLKQLLASFSSMFVGQLDQSSASALIAANFPIVGLPWQQKKVNRFGDPVGDRSWYGRIADTGVPIAFQIDQTPANEKLYPTLVEKGVAPPELRRYILEERYGQLTDEQFNKFALASGKSLKQQTQDNLAGIKSMSPETAKKFLNKAAQTADAQAAASLGLTRQVSDSGKLAGSEFKPSVRTYSPTRASTPRMMSALRKPIRSLYKPRYARLAHVPKGRMSALRRRKGGLYAGLRKRRLVSA